MRDDNDPNIHAEFNEEKQLQRVDILKKHEEEELAKALSQKYGIGYLDLTLQPVNIDALRIIKEEDARAGEIAVFNEIDKRIDVGVLSPNNPKTQEAVEVLKGKGFTPTLFMVSHQSLNKVWDMYKEMSYSFETKSGALDISNEQIVELLGRATSLKDITVLIQEVLSAKKGYRTSRMLEIILAGALATKASDVHLEPEEEYVRLRYRLDGVLQDVLNFDLETYKLLVSRVKLISNLKLNVTSSQDGRFSIKLPEGDIEIRTSLLPGAYFESIVLRILNPHSISVPLENLGIHPHLLDILKKEIAKPNGMILTTGPTGSGKTTTLYAFLKKLSTPEIKIITIENPIEYHLPGIVQTQTNADSGYTFAEGLRSALRQDPDVIMVGEIRDSETAEIAINSALTGHLVFSTLHTNNAAGTFPRLIDLGVNPKILSSAINISIAQRLVRKLCSVCRKEIELTDEQKKLVQQVIDGAPNKEFFKDVSREKAFVSVGCDACNHTGYQGRLGIYEGILMDNNIEKAVRENPSEREIFDAARGQGILSMTEDGILKVLQGTTSFEELSRVVDLSLYQSK